MENSLKIKVNLNFQKIGYIENSELKTKPCEIGEWYGEEICESIDLTKDIDFSKIPDGKYKITLNLEKIND